MGYVIYSKDASITNSWHFLCIFWQLSSEALFIVNKRLVLLKCKNTCPSAYIKSFQNAQKFKNAQENVKNSWFKHSHSTVNFWFVNKHVHNLSEEYILQRMEKQWS